MAKIVIPRLPGESDLDYKRRSGRERQRIYRRDNVRVGRGRKPGQQSLKPDPRVSWPEEEWRALRERLGDPSAPDYRKRYRLEAARLYTKYNKAQIAEKKHAKRSRPGFREAERAYQIKWTKENPDKAKAQQRRYYESHREARTEKLRLWAEENPERMAQVKALWYEENRGKRNAYASKRRALERCATPPWADLEAIEAIYDEAVRVTIETGVMHHVDHIVPLAGKTVSGLHVENNLRIITGAENMRKRNHLIEELVV